MLRVANRVCRTGPMRAILRGNVPSSHPAILLHSQSRLLTSRPAPYHWRPIARHPLHSISVRSQTNSLQTPHLPSGGRSSSETLSWQRLWLRDIALCSGVLGVGYFLWNAIRYPEQTTTPVALIELPAPDAFYHPYEDESWFWRTFITIKRAAFLAAIFLPCAAIGLIAKITQDEHIRTYWISMLIRAFESAGCSFQKFGQWMSMRPDMFPADVVEAMGSLRCDVPTHSFKHTRRMIRESFGQDLEEIFEFFDPVPVASGTIAQVHRARLKPAYARGVGVDVAVKVRHPSVLEETFVDVGLIFQFIDTCDFMTVPFDKDHFLSGLQKQINFEWEAYSLTRFARDFKNEIERGEISFPNVSLDLLSQSVLIESWAAGKSVSDYFAAVGFDFQEIASDAQAKCQELCETVDAHRRILAERMFNVCMKMFLRDNHLHGDLHGGNVMFDADSLQLTVLDAGHTTSLSPDVAMYFGRFMKGLCTGSTDDVVTSLLAFNELPLEDVDVPAFSADVELTLRKWVGPDGRQHDGRPVCIGDVVGEILFKLQNHKVSLKGDVASSIMSIAVSEGLIRQLDPDFDMNRRALPFLAKYGWPGMKTTA